jgi:hypothetical protein
VGRFELLVEEHVRGVGRYLCVYVELSYEHDAKGQSLRTESDGDNDGCTV